MGARPLSPHLGIYRFWYTMATSISHRISGLALSLGLIVLVWWLAALASGEAGFLLALSWLATWPFTVVLFLLLAAFLYHLACGVRHLLLDADVGFERPQARRSAWLIWIAALLALAVFGYLLFCPLGQQP
ncbi:MAG: succinate dehydrogenase, cytochrome b556 subunit [Gammaproteobacteria bacterium]|nr:succinate dehydrogenase, cytochrome b556 subunit [Gammaproteobacteria bacterium]